MSSPATLSTHTFSLNICNKFSVKYPSSAETTANSFTVSSCNPTGASSSCS
ncbi:MAG: hypothetical protein LBQ24_04730 [Candidatus Peribacteria bacterium]|nr:hypothetical protein [Candidatus Peribacteria bacterium]